ncbi:MAG: VOC family protein [Sphingobacteriaceae bacterium]|nr:MAG: VOC family protein [Sphingobacteriaceae bacterium]
MKADQKIIPFLWFDNNAQEAIDFYATIFKDVKIVQEVCNGKGWPGPEGSLLTAIFEIEGQKFQVLNGGPQFKFTEAISMFAVCNTQQEIDEKWEKLTADGGEESQCGWLKDKFGLSWQIAPQILGDMIADKDPEKAARVMQAMMQMVKIDIQKLQDAYDGK